MHEYDYDVPPGLAAPVKIGSFIKELEQCHLPGLAALVKTSLIIYHRLTVFGEMKMTILCLFMYINVNCQSLDFLLHLNDFKILNKFVKLKLSLSVLMVDNFSLKLIYCSFNIK